MEMRNIVVKIPGTSPDIVLFLTHYDTKRLPNFVGADDSGSSTGVMLELARLLCPRKNALTVWIAFLDGEEAFNPTVWKDPDNTYGSRELAARMALSGDLARTKAVILADMVGGKNLRLQRESNSTGWLRDMVWSTAAKLGYGDIFVSSSTAVEDDHGAFLARHVPAVDIIDLDTPQRLGYWHMPQDTLDKLSARSLAVVGHVLIAVVPQLEQKFARANAALLP
jgi:Zn-dependent M28 family amino/carboxypeptidase